MRRRRVSVLGWTVTLVAGLTAFAKADAEKSFALIAVVAVVVFCLLDAYYLALEHRFREKVQGGAA